MLSGVIMKLNSQKLAFQILMLFIACGSFQGVLVAQDESGPPKPPPTYIELTSVKVVKVKDDWQLRVAEAVVQQIIGQFSAAAEWYAGIRNVVWLHEAFNE